MPYPPERLSPDWWRDRLLDQFQQDAQERRQMLDVYEGSHPLPVWSSKYASQYLAILAAARTPWGRMIVDTTAERLMFQGVRTGPGQTDDRVWSWFKRASMDQSQRSIYREAMACGTGYASAWPGDGSPQLMPESAMQVTHEYVAGSTSEVAAAIKVWTDEAEEIWRLDLYLPDQVVKYWAAWSQGSDYPRGAVWNEISAERNPMGAVPIVPFVCRRDWNGRGRSELADLKPLFDRFETVTADMLVASSYGAFRQRWATGLEIPTDPDTGEEVEPFRAAVDRLWISEDVETKFGAFDATDLTPYVRLKDAIVAEIAAISRVPSSYFVQSELANPPSAQALEASEVNLISKVKERQEAFGDAWERLVMYALRATGDTEADMGDIQIIWKDPRTRSESQVLDAAAKMHAIGFPFEAIATFVGYGPDEVKRLKAQRMQEQLLAGFQQAAAAPAGPGQPPAAGQQEQDAGAR